MKKNNRLAWIGILFILTFNLTGCGTAVSLGAQAPDPETQAGETSRPDAWIDETHSGEAEPDYDLIFPQDKVNTINITISPENWQAMLDNMTDMLGEMGDGSNGPGMGMPGGMNPGDGNFQLPDGMEPPEGFNPQDGNFQLPDGIEPPEGFDPQNRGGQPRQGGFPGGGPGGGGGPVSMLEENPVYVTSTVEFGDGVWTNVGIRFRGNSTLVSSWNSGTYKISVKLDFDQFEDEYPEIDDQTFYGFQELSLISNASDSSYLREKVAADIFREAGVPASQTAFYAVYIDFGEGPQYFGLYTLIESVDDTVIETQFEDNSGNVYKPEGTGASFSAGTFDEESFEKETNEDEADWSDIQALFEALHSDLRTTDPAAWRANLEKVFNVDGFLRWLAVDTVIQNWDTYGTMGHNYYLYNDPETGQLNWIPWDNNMSLSSTVGRGSTRALDLSGVGENWPLINYLAADEVYKAVYDRYVAEIIQGAFSPERMEEIYTTYHNLIQPYVTGENGEQERYTQLRSEEAFDQSLQELIEHVNSRFSAASAYLESQK